MALSLGKTEVRKMAAALEPEYADWTERHKQLKKQLKAEPDNAELEDEFERLTETLNEVEEFAADALVAAQEIIASKAKFTVVGQVKQKDNKGDKVALGWYSTEKQANDDALRLTYSTVTHEEAKAWVIKIHHGSPHEWYRARKELLKSDAGGDMPWRERELQRRVDWVDQHPGEPVPEEWGMLPWDSETVKCPTCFGTGRTPESGPYTVS